MTTVPQTIDQIDWEKINTDRGGSRSYTISALKQILYLIDPNIKPKTKKSDIVEQLDTAKKIWNCGNHSLWKDRRSTPSPCDQQLTDLKSRMEQSEIKNATTREERTASNNILTPAANGMKVGDISLFDTHDCNMCDTELWENEYQRVMDQKYKKGTRSYTEIIISDIGTCRRKTPVIYIIPRVRTESYKSYNLYDLEGEQIDINEVNFCPISKGYPMQDVSSFTLGPVPGHGLCLVNAAFSKLIAVFHIEGGGQVDLKRKIFWKRSKRQERKIEILDDQTMMVDNTIVNIVNWLKENQSKWYPEWDRWRRSVAMASIGNFHWGGEETICYRLGDQYLNYVEWKQRCYFFFANSLVPKTDVYHYLYRLKNENMPIGLVHPMGLEGFNGKPVTKDDLEDMLVDPGRRLCMPYCVALLLLRDVNPE